MHICLQVPNAQDQHVHNVHLSSGSHPQSKAAMVPRTVQEMMKEMADSRRLTQQNHGYGQDMRAQVNRVSGSPTAYAHFGHDAPVVNGECVPELRSREKCDRNCRDYCQGHTDACSYPQPSEGTTSQHHTRSHTHISGRHGREADVGRKEVGYRHSSGYSDCTSPVSMGPSERCLMPCRSDCVDARNRENDPRLARDNQVHDEARKHRYVDLMHLNSMKLS